MSGLPAPLAPKECDLRDRAGGPDVPPMPVDLAVSVMDIALCWHDDVTTVARLRLMALAWRTNPAGSLKNTPTRFAAMVWLSPKKWKRVADTVLAEWVLCSDDRLYHPWLTEQALKAWRRINARRRLDVSSAEWALLRLQTFRRDDFVCQYCETGSGPFECDHVVPVSRGGLNVLSNLVTACEDCNRRKHAMPVERFLADRPDRLTAIMQRLQTFGGVS